MIKSIPQGFYKDFFVALFEKFQYPKLKHWEFFRGVEIASNGVLTRHDFFDILKSFYCYSNEHPSLQPPFYELIIEKFELVTDSNFRPNSISCNNNNFEPAEKKTAKEVVKDFFEKKQYMEIGRKYYPSLLSVTEADQKTIFSYFSIAVTNAVTDFLTNVRKSSIAFVKNIGRANRDIIVTKEFYNKIYAKKIELECAKDTKEVINLMADILGKHALLDEKLTEMVIEPLLQFSSEQPATVIRELIYEAKKTRTCEQLELHIFSHYLDSIKQIQSQNSEFDLVI